VPKVPKYRGTKSELQIFDWCGVLPQRKIMKLFASLAIIVAANLSLAEYDVKVIKGGLNRPTGIAVSNESSPTVYFSQLPTPGISGTHGGSNSVDMLRPSTGIVTNIHMGEPDPRNLAFGVNGSLYWTCRTAGVILERQSGGAIAPLLTGLDHPNGVAVDAFGTVYYTQLPTPGVSGKNGGINTVNAFKNGIITQLAIGEPEPTDIAVNPQDGHQYWTCRTAGVILERAPNGVITKFLGGLNKPMGIAIDKRGHMFFTEVPTPGVPGSMGGGNFIWEVNLATAKRTIVHFGDPEPTDVAVDNQGRVYWTCSSAGVIVRATKDN
jgi:hypothetical protein